MSDLNTVREQIELGPAPPAPPDTGVVRRTLRRLAVRAGRAHAAHQQRINREFLGMLDDLRKQLAQTSRDVDGLRAWLHELQRRDAASKEGVHDLQQWNHELAERAESLERRLEPVARDLAASRALPGMTDVKLERMDAGLVGVALGYAGSTADTDPRSAYLVFENTFRGSEELIRGRQKVYLPLLEGNDPVLDIGCGRGELLELLRDAQIPARGIDVDSAMVDHCHAKGLSEVEQADGIAYLARLEEASLGAVVALQVIEHLPYQQLLEFVREAHRALRPGGRLIMETVNPHAPQALKTFWVDLSHCHPVFPEVALALCRMAGFAKAFVFHPGGSGDAEHDRFEVGDYAVVGERAHSDAPDPSWSSREERARLASTDE